MLRKQQNYLHGWLNLYFTCIFYCGAGEEGEKVLIKSLPVLLSSWLLVRGWNCFVLFNYSVRGISLNVDVTLRFTKIIYNLWVIQVSMNQRPLSWWYRWVLKWGGMRARVWRAACGWAGRGRNPGLCMASPGLWLPHSYCHLCIVSFSTYVLAPIMRQILRELIATTWMNLENIMLSERSQHKDHILWFHLYEMSRTGKPTETK